jgi:protein-S-isoprenylcysteine O-methyltransferase Ste14
VLADTFIAIFLFICLVSFTAINLHNIVIVHKRRNGQKSQAKVEHPSGFIVSLAALGTGIYFLEVCLYIFLILTNLISLTTFPFTFHLPFQLFFQISGFTLTSAGNLLFLWSIITRGRDATSWEMRPNHRLVTVGPYSYVRHPSYLGYFLMFIGLPLLIPSTVMLIPLIGIPGYAKVTSQEEKLLLAHFGDRYLEYQKRTGRFIPRIKRKN